MKQTDGPSGAPHNTIMIAAFRLQMVWFLIAFAAAQIGAAPGHAQTGRIVDLELVLAIDASTSVDAEEFALQRQGLAEAFLHPDVVGAIQAAGDLGVAVTIIQWSGSGQQFISVPWVLVRDRDSAAQFSQRIRQAPRSIQGMTAIGDAIHFSIAALQANAFEGRRLVIDVSGDGSGDARTSEAGRDRAIARGITVNGLVIDNEDIDLGVLAKLDVRDHYANHVIGGFGAFLMNAADFADFRIAIRRKLIREITGPATARGPSADIPFAVGDARSLH